MFVFVWARTFRLRSTSWLWTAHCRSFWKPGAACKWTLSRVCLSQTLSTAIKARKSTSFERAKEVKRTLMTNVINKMLLMKDLSLKWWKCSKRFEIQGCFLGWSIKKGIQTGDLGDFHGIRWQTLYKIREVVFFFWLLAVVLNQIIWLCEHWN